MLRCFFISVISIFFLHSFSIAQIAKKLDSLKRICQTASSNEDKVLAYGKLAEYYFIYQMENEGDSVLKEQLRIAELSGNEDLILNAYFGNAVMYISIWEKKESFNKVLQYLKKGLSYTKKIGRKDYETLSYIRISTVYRKTGDLQNSYDNAIQANASSLNIKNDSIKILANIEVGNSYLAQEKLESAFQYYIKAYDDAVKFDYFSLQSEWLHRISNLYNSIDDSTMSKKYLDQSLKLNKEHNNNEGMVKDYIGLAHLTSEINYIQDALKLSDSLKLENYYIQAKGFMYGYYTTKKSSDSTLIFIKNNPDLTEIWMNTGMPIYYMNFGSVYQYSGKFDSALYYLLLAKHGFEKDNNDKNNEMLYAEIGGCYEGLMNYHQAIYYLEKALDLNSRVDNVKQADYYTLSLSKLYEKIGDFKKAIEYSRRNEKLKDTLQSINDTKKNYRNEMAILDIEEKKKKDDLELKEKRKRDIQYWSISISISAFFILLVVIGMLPVSKLTTKLLEFLAFISLFEFIILLTEPILKELADDQPLRVWILKILLIALLVPLQHYLEKAMHRFLQNLKRKHNLSIKKWLIRKKKPTASTIENIEKDTAVL